MEWFETNMKTKDKATKGRGSDLTHSIHTGLIQLRVMLFRFWTEWSDLHSATFPLPLLVWNHVDVRAQASLNHTLVTKEHSCSVCCVYAFLQFIVLTATKGRISLVVFCHHFVTFITVEFPTRAREKKGKAARHWTGSQQWKPFRWPPGISDCQHHGRLSP